MGLTLEELTVVQTEDQVFDAFLQALVSRGIPANTWRKGGSLRNMMRIVAHSYADFTAVMSRAIRGQFLDLAADNWLTLLAHYVYGVDRIPATFATGKVTLTNALGGLYVIPAGGLTVKNSTTGMSYTNTSPITVNPTSTLANVDVIALVSGSSSTSGPDFVDTMVTTFLGVTVTNPSAIVGTDEETDATLAQRCRDKLEALSPLGPRGAYAYAIGVAKRLDGSPVDISRHKIKADPATGILNVYIASPSGPPTTPDITAVILSIENIARPDTVSVSVAGATAVALSEVITVWALDTPGFAQADFVALIDTVLATKMSQYPIGGIPKPPVHQGYLYRSTVEGWVLDAHDSIYAVDTLIGDLAIGPGEVATLSTVINVKITPRTAG